MRTGGAAAKRVVARREGAVDDAVVHPGSPTDGRGLVSGGLRIAWNESHQLRLALGENDV